MRYFNYHGPVNPQQHYFVPRRELLAKLMVQLERSKYFSIFAPRQMGKTTFMRQVLAHVNGLPQYVGVEVSFENYRDLDEARFCEELRRDVDARLEAELSRQKVANNADLAAYLGSGPMRDVVDWSNYYTRVGELLFPHRLVLIVDEFDILAWEVAENFLHTLRKIYIMRDESRNPVFHSVALFSIRDVADVVQTGSPFNIAYKIQLQAFTREQVEELLTQHTEETGQPFTDEVIERIYEQTGGHPFLVNRLAAILTDDVVPDHSTLITNQHLSRALGQILVERNDNFATLFSHADLLSDSVMRVLWGGPLEFNLSDDRVYQMMLYGIARDDDGMCEITNPIYKQKLTMHFRPTFATLQAEAVRNGLDWRQYLREDKLDLGAVLRDFVRFVERRGQTAFALTETPREAMGQYLLMAYIDLLVKAVGGDAFLEVPTGRGRMDIIVVRTGERHVIEMKIWRGIASLEEGQEQLARYLDTEGVEEGHLVVFNARPRVYGKMKVEELVFDVEVEGKVIHNYMVRLGQTFEGQEASNTAQ